MAGSGGMLPDRTLAVYRIYISLSRRAVWSVMRHGSELGPERILIGLRTTLGVLLGWWADFEDSLSEAQLSTVVWLKLVRRHTACELLERFLLVFEANKLLQKRE